MVAIAMLSPGSSSSLAELALILFRVQYLPFIEKKFVLFKFAYKYKFSNEVGLLSFPPLLLCTAWLKQCRYWHKLCCLSLYFAPAIINKKCAQVTAILLTFIRFTDCFRFSIFNN